MSESTKTTIGLQMAKATEQDMSASVRLASILSDVHKGYYPMAATSAESENEPLIFDEDDRDHLRTFYDRVMACMNAAPGGLFRVVWGFSTLMSNNVCDPDADVLEFHPRFSEQQPTWQTGTPPTKVGNYDEYIVAVRRKAVPGRVFVFASNYANSYGKEELNDQDGNEYIANGWYTVGHDTSGEFDSLFMPMLESGDEVIGWQPLPKWSDVPC